jgi:hypothetical protein
MRNRDYLFSQVDTFSIQQNRRQQMQAEIASFDPNRLLNTNIDDLEQIPLMLHRSRRDGGMRRIPAL